MSATQTSFNQFPGRALEGQLGDPSLCNVRSLVNGESTAEVPFGVMVAWGDDGKAELVDSGDDSLAGIVVHSHNHQKDRQLGDDGIKPDEPMNVLRQGVVFVKATEAVEPGDTVRVRHSGTGQAGEFLKDAEAGETLDISDFAQWLDKGAAGDIVRLEIDMTNAAQASADA